MISFEILYNVLGVACLVALLWMLLSLIMAFKKAPPPRTFKSVILPVFLGLTAGLSGTFVAIWVRMIMLRNLHDTPDYLYVIAMIYLPAVMACLAAYILGRIVEKINKDGARKITTRSALVVVLALILQPVISSWL